MRLPADLGAPLAALALIAAAPALAGAPPLAGPPSAADRLGPAGDYPVTIGEPFSVDGVTYTPLDTLNYDAVGYVVETDGAGVAAGHRTLPFPSYVEVTALDSGKTALVRIDRRGPMTGDALIELTPMARAQLGLAPGVRAPVRVRRVNPPEAERALLRAGQEAPARMDTPPGLLAALKRKLGVAPAPSTGPALIDVPASSAVPPQVATPLPGSSPPAPARPASKPKPTTAARAPVPAAASAPASAPASPAPLPSTAGPAVATAPAPSTAFVQVGAFSTRARAETAARQVGGVVSPAGTLWRVRIPASSTAAAQAALAKAKRAGYADARVVPSK
ncbi:SPOR domain-containing protein [Novosphingobium huizhouense]|uniref:SPOR domain-containing protein n=1 Tax=Novosphingobium huizhouense TaxID=2866625 RepID=UPI001CD838B5|nr:SPOR domain-containing protein [Novosphingobium huizhouense]